MRKSTGIAVSGALGLGIGLAAAAGIHSAYTTAGIPAAPQSALASAAAPAAGAPSVIDTIYPLFNAGLSWSPKLPVSLPPKSLYNPTDKTIVGYQVTSLPTASTEDIGGTVEPLRNYYDQLLVRAGWRININFEADGPGGSFWGFTKGGKVVIFSYTSSFYNQEPGQPRQCPCTVVFTIIGGTLS